MMKRGILILFSIFIMLTGCSSNKQKDYTFFAMDTMINLTLYNVENSDEIAKEIENIYLKYDALADDYYAGKNVVNVYDLNKAREKEVSLELKELLEFSMEMLEDTKGYFNPFIGRLSHLWKEALGKGELLEEDIITNELEIMKETFLEIEGNRIKIKGMGNLDLGGVAKGFATNKAEEYLKSVSCKGYLLNAGSSNLLLGEKYGDNFSVGLSRATANGYFYTLKIKNKAIGTSSIAQQLIIIDGKRYSHILNPKTGYPAMEYDSISIIGEDSGKLDVYSTACFSMSLQELEEFLKERELDYLISKNNELVSKSLGVDNYA